MVRTSHSIEIQRPAAVVFDLVHDYERRLLWDPFLCGARILGGAGEAGVGVSTLCTAKRRLGGLAMETVYISYDRPHRAAVKMTRGPFFIQRFAASLIHETIDSDRCRTIYTLEVRGRPRWLGRVLDPLLARVLGHETEGRLRALKQFVEARTDAG